MFGIVRSGFLRVLSILAAIALLIGSSLPASAAAEVINSNEEVEFNMLVDISCANDGAGESVLMTGSLHSQYHTTINGSRYVTTYQNNPQGITGTGQVTGAKYQGTGVTRGTSVAGTVGAQNTYVNNFRMIGQGPGNNFMVHYTTHFTVNANGTQTATVDISRVTCS